MKRDVQRSADVQLVAEFARQVVDAEMAYRRECYPGLIGSRRLELEAARSYRIDLLDVALRRESPTPVKRCEVCSVMLDDDGGRFCDTACRLVFDEERSCASGGTARVEPRAPVKIAEPKRSPVVRAASPADSGTRSEHGDSGPHESDLDNRTEAALERETDKAGPAVRCFACGTDQPEAGCSHMVGVGWSCVDRKACRARRVCPVDGPSPRQALDGLFNGAVSGGIGGVHAAKLFNVARKALDDAQAEAERLRKGWADDRNGPKCSRGEYVAALEAMEFSTRTATIEECARWLEESEDLDLVAGRMRKEMREVKP